jgi:glycosyltransferase involved in cell wall biosynthesis
MSKPSTAVLMATYNGERYVGEFLESLVAQSFKDFTLYVRDDGSSDRTLAIVQTFSERLDIVIVESRERLGPARSFFDLLAAASTEHSWYLFADQDDYWLETKIGSAVEHLAANGPGPCLYCSRLEYVDSKLEYLELSAVPRIIALENALVENIVTGCTMGINASARRLVLAAPSTGMLMHDWWLYIVLVALGRVHYDRIPHIRYRQHSSNAVGAATSFSGRFRRRLKRFMSYEEESGYRISAQARAFGQAFGPQLDRAQLELVQALAAEKTVRNRMYLAFRSGLARQSTFDDLVLKLLFLTGRY